MSNAAISQHLKVLREAGLVEVRASGTFRFYSLNIDFFEGVEAWMKAIEVNWNESVNKLEGVMARIEDQRRSTQKYLAVPIGKIPLEYSPMREIKISREFDYPFDTLRPHQMQIYKTRLLHLHYGLASTETLHGSVST